jgi:hypothetical protein
MTPIFCLSVGEGVHRLKRKVTPVASVVAVAVMPPVPYVIFQQVPHLGDFQPEMVCAPPTFGNVRSWENVWEPKWAMIPFALSEQAMVSSEPVGT